MVNFEVAIFSSFQDMCLLGVLLILYHLGDFRAKPPILGSRDRKSHDKENSNNSNPVRDRERVTMDHYMKPGPGFQNPKLFWSPWQRDG